MITKETNLSGSMLNYDWINPRNNSADFTFNKYLSEDKYFYDDKGDHMKKINMNMDKQEKQHGIIPRHTQKLRR